MFIKGRHYRNYLSGALKQDPEMVKKAVQDWRDRLPFTNEQIASAIEQLGIEMPNDHLRQNYQRAAKTVRDGHLSSSLVRMAIPALVKTCAICAKTALYRQGCSGRCKAHRYVLDAYIIEQRARYSAKAADIERQERLRVLKETAQKYAHASAKFRKG